MSRQYTLTSLASSNVASYISLFILERYIPKYYVEILIASLDDVKLYVAFTSMSYILATTLRHTIASSSSIEIRRKYRRYTMTVLHRLKEEEKSGPNCASIEMRAQLEACYVNAITARVRALDLRLVGCHA